MVGAAADGAGAAVVEGGRGVWGVAGRWGIGECIGILSCVWAVTGWPPQGRETGRISKGGWGGEEGC